MMKVEEISDEQHFSDVLALNTEVLVDFWAPWCGPCKAMTPIFEQVAEEQSTRLKVVKVNVDNIPSLAHKYGIRGIPSLLLLKNQEVASVHVGAAPKHEVLDWLNEH